MYQRNQKAPFFKEKDKEEADEFDEQYEQPFFEKQKAKNELKARLYDKGF